MTVGVSVCKNCHVRLDDCVELRPWNSLEVPASSSVVNGGVDWSGLGSTSQLYQELT